MAQAKDLILVVDDEPAIRAVVKMILEDAGFDVLTANDGIEGVEMFRKHSVEITAVLLDWMMPRMNGGEAFAEMHRIRPDVPVISCSANVGPTKRQQLTADGMAGFIQKPFSTTELVGKVKAIINRK